MVLDRFGELISVDLLVLLVQSEPSARPASPTKYLVLLTRVESWDSRRYWLMVISLGGW